MHTVEMTISNETRRPRRRRDPEAILGGLVEQCKGLQPGDMLPSLQELMHQYEASERSVRGALDELRRQGLIVRRQGAGTFVAENGRHSNGGVGRGRVPLVSSKAAESRTIVAMGPPDHAVFDQAMKQLFRRVEDQDLSLVCRFVEPANAGMALPAQTEDVLGFVLFRWDLLPLAVQLQELGHRVIVIGAPPAGEIPTVPCIYGEHEQGAYLATSHLIELGHRHIAFCGNDHGLQTLRWQGHQRALREARRKGIALKDSLLIGEEMKTWVDNPADGESVFLTAGAPTGLVAWNDHEAVALIGVLARFGLDVPRDVSLVGYDNLSEGQLVHPKLTTVDSSMDYQVQAALNFLTRSEPVSGSYQMVVLPTLIRRESTAPRIIGA